MWHHDLRWPSDTDWWQLDQRTGIMFADHFAKKWRTDMPSRFLTPCGALIERVPLYDTAPGGYGSKSEPGGLDHQLDTTLEHCTPERVFEAFHVPHQIMLFLQFDIVATRHVDRSHSGSATPAFAVQRHSQQQPLDFTPLTGSYTGGSQICLAAAAGLLLLALLAHLAKGCERMRKVQR